MSHAKLSPSSAYRWLACPGSVALCADAPPDESNEFADEGTAAHTLASWVLSDKHKTTAYYRGAVIDVRNEDGSLRRQFTVEEDFADYVQVYVDCVRDRLVGEAELLIEQKLDTGLVSKRYGAVTGTGDAIILRPFDKIIEVHDLKYGRGVRVEARDNPQLMLYALGVLRGYAWLMPVERIVVGIHQPRLDHMDLIEYTVDELEQFASHVRDELYDMDNGNDSLNPGEKQCRFCPAAATCPALRGHAQKAALDDFAFISDLTEYGIGAAMDQVELVERWCEAVRAEARRLLDNGTKVPGWCLEEGRQGNRKWSDEAAVLKAMVTLGDAAYKPRAVISPADAEKKLSKKDAKLWTALQPLIVRGAPTVNMVRDDGKRKPLAASVKDDFKVIQ